MLASALWFASSHSNTSLGIGAAAEFEKAAASPRAAGGGFVTTGSWPYICTNGAIAPLPYFDVIICRS
jgi:hypothetical protein